MFDSPPKIAYFCYTEYQDGYEEMKSWPGVVLIDGLVDFELLKANRQQHKLVIFDDMMEYLSKEKSGETLDKFFSTYCHHWSASCIFIVQSMFYKNMITARRNAKYVLLMRCPQDEYQIEILGRRLFSRANYPPKYFMEAYGDATSSPYGYLMIDNSPLTNPSYRLSTNIFPDQFRIMYVPKTVDR